jgi:predicted ATP-binding protein involved in virulence
MRIDRIDLTNFKCFDQKSFSFDPEFTLFVGENGAGKTSILSAVAVALGIFELNDRIKRTIRPNERAWRRIYDDEIRLVPAKAGDRGLFEPSKVCDITAEGVFSPVSEPVKWSRLVEDGRRRNRAKEATLALDSVIEAAAAQQSPAPLLAYYGAGATWLPSNERAQRPGKEIKKPQQWDGYYDCLQERVRNKDIQQWFRDEAAARDERLGWRPGFQTVRWAILNCIPGAQEMKWDPDRMEICLNIDGFTVPTSMLSDGQRSMYEKVADLAIRAVMLNSFLFGDDKEIPEPPGLPIVLAQTPGVVLIDEVDVHLHPQWQRRVVADLRRTFPKVQFICTTHSPQVMGEVPIIIGDRKTGQVWILGRNGPRHPSVNFADSNWNLEHQMGAEVESRNTRVGALLNKAEVAMIEQELELAESSLEEARELMGGEDGELTRLESSLETLKKLAHEDD